MRNASSFDYSDQSTESLSVISAMNSPLVGYSSFGIGSPSFIRGIYPGRSFPRREIQGKSAFPGIMLGNVSNRPALFAHQQIQQRAAHQDRSPPQVMRKIIAGFKKLPGQQGDERLALVGDLCSRSQSGYPLPGRFRRTANKTPLPAPPAISNFCSSSILHYQFMLQF